MTIKFYEIYGNAWIVILRDKTALPECKGVMQRQFHTPVVKGSYKCSAVPVFSYHRVVVYEECAGPCKIFPLPPASVKLNP